MLASLANKSSPTDVEQIVGRILRQPYATPHANALLNCSYVLSCSVDFQHTIASVVKGLNEAGFSKCDYRAPAEAGGGSSRSDSAPLGVGDSFADIRVQPKAEAGVTGGTEPVEETTPELDEMLEEASSAATAYDEQASAAADDGTIWVTPETPAAKPVKMQGRFRAEAEELKIPQFFIRSEADIFGEGRDLLSPENLTEGFSLAHADAHVDFDVSLDKAVSVDVEESGDGVPRYKMLSAREREFITKMMAGETAERKLVRAVDILYGLVNKFNDVNPKEIRPYVRRVLEGLPRSDLDALDQVLPALAERIHEKIDALKADHCFRKFREGLDASEIVCDPNYRLPDSISPVSSTSLLAKSLYDAEYADMTSLEQEAITAIAGLENVKWWHRIKDRRGFCLNGFINHYPDFMVMTHSGTLVLVETKGDHLDNSDSKRKLALGRAWQNATDNHYKYFMVYKDRDLQLDGAYPLAQFLNILREL